MQWTDEGIVLGSKRHGEANAILELMTRAHGRHLGLVRGGASSRLRPVLQPGNRVSSHLAGAARRASRSLRGRRPRCARGVVSAGPARALRRDASRRALPAAARARPASADPCRARGGARRPARSRAAPDAGVVRFELQLLGGARLWPRSFDLRGERGRGRPRLRLAEIGPRGVAAGGRAVEGPAVAAAGVSCARRSPAIPRRRTSPTASR